MNKLLFPQGRRCILADRRPHCCRHVISSSLPRRRSGCNPPSCSIPTMTGMARNKKSVFWKSSKHVYKKRVKNNVRHVSDFIITHCKLFDSQHPNLKWDQVLCFNESIFSNNHTSLNVDQIQTFNRLNYGCGQPPSRNTLYFSVAVKISKLSFVNKFNLHKNVTVQAFCANQTKLFISVGALLLSSPASCTPPLVRLAQRNQVPHGTHSDMSDWTVVHPHRKLHCKHSIRSRVWNSGIPSRKA